MEGDTAKALLDSLQAIAKEGGWSLEDSAFAEEMDRRDPFAKFKSKFHHPTIPGTDKPYIYLCGNSLGLQPKTAEKYVMYELEQWRKKGVEGHFLPDKIQLEEGKEREIHPWLTSDENVIEWSSHIVGAKPIEVAVMNGLTVNIHLMMVPFYRPTPTRYKILIESKAFPSDLYAVQSQIKFHGFDPETALIQLSNAEGEGPLSTESILDVIEKEGDSIALVFFSGVQYYSGQFFDIKRITEAGHRKGCVVGFDLAHAAGNVPLKLHDWDVDFAVWCSYKYLNSGPGGIAGCFVHEKHAHSSELPRFAGWWSQNIKTRFDMCQPFDPEPGAFGFRLSNTPVLPCALLMASLEIYEEAGGVEKLRAKSELLTCYLEYLLSTLIGDKAIILTPRNPKERGCQLSVKFQVDASQLNEHLAAKGVISDVRKPNVIRFAPVPLYNTFEEVRAFAFILKEALQGFA